MFITRIRSVAARFGVALLGVVLVTILQGFGQEQAPSARTPNPNGNLALLREAAKAISAGDLQLAEVELNTILQTSPRDYRALNFMGILRAQQKRESEAEGFFKQVIEIKPDFAGGHSALGLLYMQMGKQDDAIAQLREALRLDPSRTDARDSLVQLWISEAGEALKAENPEKSLAALLQARKIKPDDPNVEYRLGMVALRMSLFADAMEAFQNVLKFRSDDAAALYGLGRAQSGAAKFPEAKITFAKYVQMHPDDPSGQFALGLVLQTLQENQAARRCFQRSIELRPAQTESYFRLGLLDLDENHLDDAEANFQTTLKRDPKHAGALTGSGRVAFQKKNYDQAAQQLRQAIASDPSLREAHYYLGLDYARLGQKDESAKELEIATKLEHDEVERYQHALKVLDLEEKAPTSSDLVK
jgi:tetratricopeptide (TPR) repeat protein